MGQGVGEGEWGGTGKREERGNFGWDVKSNEQTKSQGIYQAGSQCHFFYPSSLP